MKVYVTRNTTIHGKPAATMRLSAFLYYLSTSVSSQTRQTLAVFGLYMVFFKKFIIIQYPKITLSLKNILSVSATLKLRSFSGQHQEAVQSSLPSQPTYLWTVLVALFHPLRSTSNFLC